MARHHLINGIKVPFSVEEEAQWDANELAYADGAFDRSIARLREDRNRKLAETDFYALSDNTLSDEMKQYRKDLRDITIGLSTVEDVNNVTWPTKPE